MTLEFTTINHWDEKIWIKAGFVYHQAFEKGAKPDKIIQNMFKKELCFLHLLIEDSDVIGIAITGNLKETLLIDYLGILRDYQNQGFGRKLVDYIKVWAKKMQFKNIILEAEAERTPENLKRIDFWEKCGFILTEYIHQYIWVPEPYQAMYLTLIPNHELPKDGEELFRIITHFHKKSFQRE